MSGSEQWLGYDDGREGAVMTMTPSGYDSNPAVTGGNAYVNTSHYNDSTPCVAEQQRSQRLNEACVN